MSNKYPARFADRRKDLATIHMAAVQLGMDTIDRSEDSAYRSMLWTVARVRSSAALDWAGRKKVIDHLKACGWKPTGVAKGKPATVKPELIPLMGKIGALLADMKLPWAYAAAILKTQTKAQGAGIERLEWANTQQLHAVVTALVKRQASLASKPVPSPVQGEGSDGGRSYGYHRHHHVRRAVLRDWHGRRRALDICELAQAEASPAHGH